MTSRRVRRRFYGLGPAEVAPELLGKVLVVGDRRGRIVEVEAYGGGDDPASHAARGMTPRTATMFGPPGRLYVYFTYGMHWCANVVCGGEGVAAAVLIRALVPMAGIDAMREVRPTARSDRDLCRGPARLTQAMGIDGRHNGVDLVAADAPVTIVDDGVAPPVEPGVGPRVGIRAATERPWRWWVPDEPCVSPIRRPGSPRS